jgi:hypothetical protein
MISKCPSADTASNSASTTIGSSAQGDDKISWNFRDGTKTVTEPISARFSHTFPGPGLYLVTASVTDNLQRTYSWTQPVMIDLPLAAAVDEDPRPNNTIALTAQARGGAWSVVAAHWAFSDGTTADGVSITMPAKQLDGSVTLTDVPVTRRRPACTSSKHPRRPVGGDRGHRPDRRGREISPFL